MRQILSALAFMHKRGIVNGYVFNNRYYKSFSIEIFQQRISSL